MFEATLSAFKGSGSVRRKLAVMPLAVLLHGVAFVGVAMAGILTVRELPEPILTATFYHVPAPPAAPPRAQSAKPAAPRTTTPARPAEVVQIDRIPDESAKRAIPEPTGETVVGGDPEGDPDSTDGDVIGGVPRSKVSAISEPVPVRRDEPVDVRSTGVVAPVALERPAPAYPELARKIRVQGQVLLHAVIDKDGNVVDVRILRDIGMGCGAAAQEAVQRWRYRPATRGGRPVAVFLTVAVTFGLN